MDPAEGRRQTLRGDPASGGKKNKGGEIMSVADRALGQGKKKTSSS